MEYLTEQDCYIGNDYLTPIKHDKVIHQNLILNVYKMLNTRASQAGLSYYTTLFGYCKSCNITIDSSSEARLSVNLSLILDDSIKDDLLVAPDSLIWLDSAFQVQKQYIMINEDTGEHTEKTVNFGFILPDQNSFNYSAETRELSVTGADMITTLTQSRGTELYDQTMQDEEIWQYSGLLIKGNQEDYRRDFSYTNFYESCKRMGKSDEEISSLWDKTYKDFSQYYEDNKKQFPSEADTYKNIGMQTPYETVQKVWAKYYKGAFFPTRPYVRLWNMDKTIPKDLEFDGTATELDIYKAITDLYLNQCVYFDNEMRLTLEELPSSHYDKFQDCRFLSREFGDILISENINYNYENIVNYVTVFGRDNICAGKYEIRTGWQCQNPDCNNRVIYAYKTETCPVCGEETELVGQEYELSSDRIGVHKKVINSDSYYTDQECADAAKAECLMANKMSETITLTLVDTWLSCLELSNLGVGRKIEYTPKATGETNVYTLDKLSNDVGGGTWTLELTRFYPIRTITAPSQMLDFRNGNFAPLVEPKFEGYELSDTGLLTIYISNGNDGKFSLYKIYKEVKWRNAEDVENWADCVLNTRNKFIGETCTYVSDEEQEKYNFPYPTKKFQIQLYSDGTYRFRATAFNPNFAPSLYSSTFYKNTLEVKVDIFKRRLKFNYNSILTLEDGGYLLVSE